MRKSITVSVKKEHWDAGLANAWKTQSGELLIHDNNCPLALALREKLNARVRVNGNIAVVDGYNYKLDKAGSKFVAHFDDHDEEDVPKFPIKVKLTLTKETR